MAETISILAIRFIIGHLSHSEVLDMFILSLIYQGLFEGIFIGGYTENGINVEYPGFFRLCVGDLEFENG